MIFSFILKNYSLSLLIHPYLSFHLLLSNYLILKYTSSWLWLNVFALALCHLPYYPLYFLLSVTYYIFIYYRKPYLLYLLCCDSIGYFNLFLFWYYCHCSHTYIFMYFYIWIYSAFMINLIGLICFLNYQNMDFIYIHKYSILIFIEFIHDGAWFVVYVRKEGYDDFNIIWSDEGHFMFITYFFPLIFYT